MGRCRIHAIASLLVLSFSIFTGISNEKIKGNKGKLNKAKNKRKADEISSGPVDGHLIKQSMCVSFFICVGLHSAHASFNFSYSIFIYQLLFMFDS